jgi:hypothetical protein
LWLASLHRLLLKDVAVIDQVIPSLISKKLSHRRQSYKSIFPGRLRGWRLRGWRLRGWRLRGWRLRGWRLRGWRLRGWRLEEVGA